MYDVVQLLVMTVLTVGYGDLVPRSDGGRAITVLAGAVGMLLFALVLLGLFAFQHHGSRAEAKVRRVLFPTLCCKDSSAALYLFVLLLPQQSYPDDVARCVATL